MLEGHQIVTIAFDLEITNLSFGVFLLILQKLNKLCWQFEKFQIQKVFLQTVMFYQLSSEG